MFPSLDLSSCATTSWHIAPDIPLRAATLFGVAAALMWTMGRRRYPGSRPLVLQLWVLAAWLIADILEHAALAPSCKISLAIAIWPVKLIQQPLWVWLIYETQQQRIDVPSRHVRWLLAAPSLLFSAIALTNGWHGLWYGVGTTPREFSGVPQIVYDYQPVFYAAVALGYSWMLFAYVLLWQAWSRTEPGDRKLWGTFFTMSTLSAITCAAYVFLGFRILGADPTSTSFSVVVVGLVWLISREELTTLVPMAHRALFEGLPDPLIVVDEDGRVIEANPAAHGLAPCARIGESLASWGTVGGLLEPHVKSGPDGHVLTLHDPERHFDVRARDLSRRGRRFGLIIQLRDVTRHERARRQVLRRLAERDVQHTELREQALRDPLTKVWNRRALEEQFAVAADAAAEAATPVGLAILDLDRFKLLNDTHGHPAGDAVLVAFARELQSIVRANDGVFRIGGEEFVLLFPGATSEDIIARLAVLHERSRTWRLGSVPEAITFSAGVADTTRDGVTLKSVLAAADRALYRAKVGGRARTAA